MTTVFDKNGDFVVIERVLPGGTRIRTTGGNVVDIPDDVVTVVAQVLATKAPPDATSSVDVRFSSVDFDEVETRHVDALLRRQGEPEHGRSWRCPFRPGDDVVGISDCGNHVVIRTRVDHVDGMRVYTRAGRSSYGEFVSYWAPCLDENGRVVYRLHHRGRLFDHESRLEHAERARFRVGDRVAAVGADGKARFYATVDHIRFCATADHAYPMRVYTDAGRNQFGNHVSYWAPRVEGDDVVYRLGGEASVLRLVPAESADPG